MPVRSRSLSEFPPKCQTAGGGFPWIWRFSIKVCGELRVTCRPILHSSGCLSCVETVRPLCCGSGEADHFTPTCRRWPAHGPQNKTLSVCSSVERCPVCAWPGRGLRCLSQVNPCHFTCWCPCTQEFNLFIPEEEASFNSRGRRRCVAFISTVTIQTIRGDFKELL